MQAAVSRQIAQRRPANAAAVRTKRCVLQTFCKRGGQPSLSAAQSRRRGRFGRRKRSFGKRRRFCLWTSPPAKVRKERLSQKDKSGAAGQERLRQGLTQDGTAPFLRQAARKAPQPVLSFLREKSARAVLSFAGHLMRNQKRRRADGAAAPQDGKAPAKTRRAEAAVRRGPLRRDAHAGRRKPPRREGFPARSTRPRRANRPRRRSRASDRKTGRFPPLAACQRRRILQTPARARFCPPSAKGESQRRQSPRRPSRRPEAPPNARGAKSRAGGPPDGPRTPAVASGLRADRLFYSNCKGRFSSLFFSILIMLVPNPPRTARRKRQEGRFFLEDHH